MIQNHIQNILKLKIILFVNVVQDNIKYNNEQILQESDWTFAKDIGVPK